MKHIITINLDDKTFEILERGSRDLNIPKSMLIRWLLKNFFEENKSQQKKD